MSVSIRVGGVPEHFNLPWHLAKEQGRFEEYNIDLQWTDYKGGTGAMCKALHEGEADVCVMLTEGAIAHIVNHSSFKIISKYVNSSLVWGVHTHVTNQLNEYKEVYDKNYAISRFGSGSHLMAVVDANSKSYKLKQEQFKVIKNLDGALESLKKLETDVFYWEKFTTKPFVDNGTLKRIGEYATPWPCFVIAVRNDFLEKNEKALTDMLKVIHRSVYNFMHYPGAIEQVSKRYGLLVEDVKDWFHSTNWSTTPYLGEKTIKNVLFALHKAGVLTEQVEKPKDFFYKSLV